MLSQNMSSEKFFNLGNIFKFHYVRSTKLGQTQKILDLVWQSGLNNIKAWPDDAESRSGFKKKFWPREHSHIPLCEVD
jgi:hypothetical protein